MSSRSFKIETGIGFGEMIMAADLHRPVAGIGDHQRDDLAISVQREVAIRGKEFARDDDLSTRSL